MGDLLRETSLVAYHFESYFFLPSTSELLEAWEKCCHSLDWSSSTGRADSLVFERNILFPHLILGAQTAGQAVWPWVRGAYWRVKWNVIYSQIRIVCFGLAWPASQQEGCASASAPWLLLLRFVVLSFEQSWSDLLKCLVKSSLVISVEEWGRGLCFPRLEQLCAWPQMSPL